MCLQAAELRESTVADVTRKRFHVAVQRHVFAERSRVGKRLSAGAARIRTFPGMDPHVDHQRLGTSETSVADAANEGRGFGVDQSMDPQSGRKPESPAADVAAVRTRIRVAPHVLLEVRTRSKLPIAHETDEWKLAGMGPLVRPQLV